MFLDKNRLWDPLEQRENFVNTDPLVRMLKMLLRALLDIVVYLCSKNVSLDTNESIKFLSRVIFRISSK